MGVFHTEGSRTRCGSGYMTPGSKNLLSRNLAATRLRSHDHVEFAYTWKKRARLSGWRRGKTNPWTQKATNWRLTPIGRESNSWSQIALSRFCFNVFEIKPKNYFSDWCEGGWMDRKGDGYTGRKYHGTGWNICVSNLTTFSTNLTNLLESGIETIISTTQQKTSQKQNSIDVCDELVPWKMLAHLYSRQFPQHNTTQRKATNTT